MDTTGKPPIPAGWWSTMPPPGAHEDMRLYAVPNVGDFVLDKDGKHRQITRVIYCADGAIQLQVTPPQ